MAKAVCDALLSVNRPQMDADADSSPMPCTGSLRRSRGALQGGSRGRSRREVCGGCPGHATANAAGGPGAAAACHLPGQPGTRQGGPWHLRHPVSPPHRLCRQARKPGHSPPHSNQYSWCALVWRLLQPYPASHFPWISWLGGGGKRGDGRSCRSVLRGLSCERQQGGSLQLSLAFRCVARCFRP